MDFTDAARGSDNFDEPRNQASGGLRPAKQTADEWADEAYTMKPGNSMGQVLIINNKEFHTEKLNTRTGTNKDAESLTNLFKKFGFKVSAINNVTTKQMLQKMDDVSNEDHSKSNCFVCVILSHGYDGLVYGTDGAKVPVKDLLSKLDGNSCATLAGKPKLSIVQACTEPEDGEGLENEPDEDEHEQTIPSLADFLTIESNIPGCYAWGEDTEEEDAGSWFIQTLCDVFSKHGNNQDVGKMLKTVTRKMDKKLEDNGQQGCHEVPCLTSTMMKDLYLFARI